MSNLFNILITFDGFVSIFVIKNGIINSYPRRYLYSISRSRSKTFSIQFYDAIDEPRYLSQRKLISRWSMLHRQEWLAEDWCTCHEYAVALSKARVSVLLLITGTSSRLECSSRRGGGRKVIRPLNQARTVRHIPQDRKDIGSDDDGGFEWRRIIDFIPWNPLLPRSFPYRMSQKSRKNIADDGILSTRVLVQSLRRPRQTRASAEECAVSWFGIVGVTGIISCFRGIHTFQNNTRASKEEI